MNKNKIISFACSSKRIPVEYRKDKKKAIELLEYIKTNNIKILNNDIYVLANWCDFDIKDIKKAHSEARSIEYVNKDITLDMTVPETHSYVGNGICLHNCNLPKNTTKELISEIYLKAWESGCKGFTIYREGSRDAVMKDNSVKNEDKNTLEIIENDAPKRPECLPCDVHHVKISKRLDKPRSFEYIVVVGLYGKNKKPYEVFAFENGKLDKKYTSGLLRKTARGKYHLEFEDGTKVMDITQDQTPDEEIITRAFSQELRHGVPVKYLVHQIEKTKEEMTSFVKCIGRALKKYIEDGSAVTGEICEKCQGKLVRISGCVSCPSCGWTKCQ